MVENNSHTHTHTCTHAHARTHRAFTPKRTKSQFRAGARASSKQVPALSQLRTSWFHTGQSQPWSRCEQCHDVTANVSAFPATLPPCRNCTIRRRTLAQVSNTTTTISSSIQSVYGSFFQYSDLKQNQKKQLTVVIRFF